MLSIILPNWWLTMQLVPWTQYLPCKSLSMHHTITTMKKSSSKLDTNQLLWHYNMPLSMLVCQSSFRNWYAVLTMQHCEHLAVLVDLSLTCLHCTSISVLSMYVYVQPGQMSLWTDRKINTSTPSIELTLWTPDCSMVFFLVFFPLTF